MSWPQRSAGAAQSTSRCGPSSRGFPVMTKAVRSQMLVANAWHARSDAASSLVVIVGIALGVTLAVYYLT